MAQTQHLRPVADDDDGGSGQPPWEDIRLDPRERDEVLTACASLYATQQAADRILDRIGFPRGQRPGFGGGTAPLDVWSGIFHDAESGVIRAPHWRLLEAISRTYQHHPVIRPIAQRHGLLPPDPTSGAPEPPRPAESPEPPRPVPAPETPEPPAAADPDVCHLIVRGATEQDRREAQAALDQLGLRPTEVWSTAHVVSYALDATDPSSVRARLEAADPDALLGWTLVPPGRPDYVLHTLHVAGPDGRRFRISDAPAQQLVREIAEEVVDHYPGFPGAERPTVVDQVSADGQGRRLGPDDTLDDAGIQDGDELRVAFQATAGSVNPQMREDALYRVRNEIRAYADAHPGFTAQADSALLPMRYRLSFAARSWAPPAQPGGEPEPTARHVVEIRLLTDFPHVPPLVVWQTPIFHPNVAPMYDTAELRVQAQGKGVVCLGVLAESYQPSLAFGDLCQMLVDLAGYRNYGLVERRTAAGGGVEIATNVYDPEALSWLKANPERIVEIGGLHPEDVIRAQAGVPADGGRRRTFPNVVEVDADPPGAPA